RRPGAGIVHRLGGTGNPEHAVVPLLLVDGRSAEARRGWLIRHLMQPYVSAGPSKDPSPALWARPGASSGNWVRLSSKPKTANVRLRAPSAHSGETVAMSMVSAVVMLSWAMR